jgi:hypothetical protein
MAHEVDVVDGDRVTGEDESERSQKEEEPLVPAAD